MDFKVAKATYTEYVESGKPAVNEEFEFSVEDGEYYPLPFFKDSSYL